MFGKGGLSCTMILVVTLALTTQAVVGDLFTSVNDMQALARQEQRLMTTLYDYISTQQEKLNHLITKLEQLKKIWPPERSIEELISDPINAYTLVRRLTREWPFILNLMMHTFDIREELPRLPKEEDLESAVRGLTRLQEVYWLDTRQLTLESWGLTHLTVSDCFEIGKYLFKEKKYKAATSWFEEALQKIANKDITDERDKILPHLFLARLYTGCEDGISLGGASKVLHYLMSQFPTYTLDKESAPLFRQSLSSICPRPESLDKTAAVDAEAYYNRIYSDTCRGVGIYHSSELSCYYIHHNNPRLLIAPFKMEEKNLNPPILMFHDVVSDQEIKDMKEAFSKVRSHCKTAVEGEEARVDYHRTCDVGWVEDDATAASARLSRRVGDMTNLAMETSEINQVASYGLGGEFKLHYDPIMEHNSPHNSNGSRIATLMFYLSDVESGGYTVFPYVNVAVKPIKGSAVFWFNLDHRSTTLYYTLHGGCAVLKGSKWVLNKWIHEGKQTSEMFCPADEKFPRPRYYLNGIK